MNVPRSSSASRSTRPRSLGVGSAISDPNTKENQPAAPLLKTGYQPSPLGNRNNLLDNAAPTATLKQPLPSTHQITSSAAAATEEVSVFMSFFKIHIPDWLVDVCLLEEALRNHRGKKEWSSCQAFPKGEAVGKRRLCESLLGDMPSHSKAVCNEGKSTLPPKYWCCSCPPHHISCSSRLCSRPLLPNPKQRLNFRFDHF
jgi:hypothetical protein